jgi:hypothetical protein
METTFASQLLTEGREVNAQSGVSGIFDRLLGSSSAAAHDAVLARFNPRWISPSASFASQAAKIAEDLRTGAKTNRDAMEELSVLVDAQILAENAALEVQEHVSLLPGRLQQLWNRSQVDKALRFVSDRLGEAVRLCEDQMRSSLLPSGKYAELARRLSEELTEADFDVADIEDSTTLSLKSDKAVEIQVRVVQELLKESEEEAAALNEAIAQAVSAASEFVENSLGWKACFPLIPFEAARIQEFTAMAALDPIQFSVEIPRVTRGKMIWNAFIQPAMLASMLLMPFWVLMMDFKAKGVVEQGVTRSGLLMYVMALLYPGYAFYQLHRVPVERRARIQRELRKMRSTVRSEILKLTRTSLDERRRVVADHARKVGEDVRQQLAECHQLHADLPFDKAARTAWLQSLREARESLNGLLADRNGTGGFQASG